MPVKSATTEFTGWVDIYPRPISIKTNDTQATVLTTGYLNSYVQLVGQIFTNEQMALVETTENSGVSFNLGWYQISISGANTSLVSTSGGSAILPVVDHHIATFDGTTGAIADQTGTAIQKGSIQAGLSGTAGTLISYPATATSGSLIVAAVANVGNKTTTISSVAGLGQNEVITIPDAGAATANFIISASGGTQHITSGALQVDAGVISSGISTGGTVGGFIAYPATASNGSLRLTPVGNVGNFASTISDVTGLGQASTYTLPDPGNAAARILVGATATPFTANHSIVASGTGGLVADAGYQMKVVAQAAVAGGAAAQTVTDAFCTSASMVVCTWNDTTNAVSIQKAVAGNGSFVVTSSGDPGASHLNYIITKV